MWLLMPNRFTFGLPSLWFVSRARTAAASRAMMRPKIYITAQHAHTQPCGGPLRRRWRCRRRQRRRSGRRHCRRRRRRHRRYLHLLDACVLAAVICAAARVMGRACVYTRLTGRVENDMRFNSKLNTCVPRGPNVEGLARRIRSQYMCVCVCAKVLSHMIRSYARIETCA